MPKASIVVPIYNVAQYLPQCLDSLMTQTERDIEILLVDDGATDDSPRLMAEYVARDARFVPIHRENGGLSAARNTGIDHARGDFLFFVDADDWVEPTLVADALAAAERHDAQQVVWNYRCFWDDRMGEAALPMRDEALNLREMGLPAYFYHYWFPYVHGQEAWARLYRRDLLERTGLRFTDGKEIFAEDTLMSAQLLLHTERLVALSKPYLYYRQRSDSIMGKQKPQLARRLMALCAQYCGYVEQQGRASELRNILPMFCYRLICKGISLDPSMEDVYQAMEEYRGNDLLRTQLEALRSGGALFAYLRHTHKGLRTQWRGRAFAARWLRGDVKGAAALVERKT